MSADWCDLCELPLSQCPHGAPPPPPPTASPRSAPARPRARKAPARTPAAIASESSTRPSTAVTARPLATRRTPPGRTPQAEFRTALLTVLADHPVAVERDTVLEAVGETMTLTDQDRGITADGEVRWRRAALKERKAMADDGLLGVAGHGLWVLSPRGREEAALVVEAAASADESDAGVDAGVESDAGVETKPGVGTDTD